MPFVERGDARIWWDEEGEGDPILLIMGLGYSADMWFRVWPRLSPRYRTIRFDNRGVGRTGVPDGPYPVELMAEDAIAVLDAAGVGAAHVFGASMGGFIAQELAVRHPERVRSLLLGCTGAGGADMVAAEPAAMEMALARASMSPEDAAEVAIPFVYSPTTPRSEIDEDFAVRMALPTSPEGYSNQLAGVVSWPGIGPRLKQVTAPTIVIHGRRDRLANPGNADVLGSLIPGAKVVLLDDASHVFFTDQTDAALDVILGFLEER
jgi:pimeloyl-ACP methyl ester carboxylesterase